MTGSVELDPPWGELQATGPGAKRKQERGKLPLRGRAEATLNLASQLYGRTLLVRGLAEQPENLQLIFRETFLLEDPGDVVGKLRDPL